MQSWRRMALIGVLAWIVGVAIWASMSWTDDVTVVVPKGQPPQSVKYGCGHLFGAAEAKPSAAAVTVAHPLAHGPCGARTQRRVLVVIDLVVGVVVLVALLTRFPAARPEPVPSTA